MQFVKHPNHTRYYGRPRDWNPTTQGPCGELSVSDQRHRSGPMMESAWEFEGMEALAVALGAAQLRLGVYGTSHPPVSIIASPVVGWTEGTKPMSSYLELARQLVDHARANGLSLTISGSGSILVQPLDGAKNGDTMMGSLPADEGGSALASRAG